MMIDVDAHPSAAPECTGAGTDCACESCQAVRAAAAAGAQPAGVPRRVYDAYLEARAALRAEDHAGACRLLAALLGYLAEERGVAAEQSLLVKVRRLRELQVLSDGLRPSLFDDAFSPAASAHKAWAMLSLAEHAFYRLYLRTTAGR